MLPASPSRARGAAVVLSRCNGPSRSSALAAIQPLPLHEAPGLRMVLHSGDFGQWERLVAGTLGHHRSRLLPGSSPFMAPIRRGAPVATAGADTGMDQRGLTSVAITGLSILIPGTCLPGGAPPSPRLDQGPVHRHLIAAGLPYDLQEQLGRTPMAAAKRRRLRRLRQLLLQPDHDHCSISELMQAAGLLACGVTAADDARRWGETPRRTRQRRTMDR
ncbi:hypothetical protein [Synechococcus sp. BA-132 BA5]|uniref:hypothetical protein n=1 Tax=Synechococcus sp. BA-132 BA5 TaxID=3110252 RepID=UPI002B21234B|nr:hypothetical protein [Synechococcus sp. BA-132 BA5]MEA5413680.1 hypothetical protein [Synechococcus sp. BA-132 BA5]